jgi:hypothetical protein
MAEALLLPYRLRTVRVGVQATFLVLAGMVALPFLPIEPALDTVPSHGVTLLRLTKAQKHNDRTHKPGEESGCLI